SSYARPNEEDLKKAGQPLCFPCWIIWMLKEKFPLIRHWWKRASQRNGGLLLGQYLWYLSLSLSWRTGPRGKMSQPSPPSEK
ncbi:hypothetical protein Dimus_020734, partial [Dionaea muscipula]